MHPPNHARSESLLSPNAFLNALLTFHPGEVWALVRLPDEEALRLLRLCLLIEGADITERAEEAASLLRQGLGLTPAETEISDLLTPQDTDNYSRLCAQCMRR